jgi:PAS domain S-box-containing protein
MASFLSVSPPFGAPRLLNDAPQAMAMAPTTGRIGADPAPRGDDDSRYRMLFDQIDEGFCIIEFLDGPHGPLSDYIHVEANPAYTANAGIPDVVGQKVRDMVPEEAEAWVRIYRDVLVTGNPVRFERELVATRRHLELSAFRIEPPARRQVAVLFKDVTARRQAEAALAESEAKFTAIANSIDQMIWSTRPDGLHDYYNDRWYEFTGAPYGSTDGEGWSDMFHPADRDRAWALWRRCLATGEPYHIEYRLRHRTGEYRWVIGRAQCVRDEDGSIARWYGTCTDVHALRTAQDRLRELNATLTERVEAAVAERSAALEELHQTRKLETLGQLTGGIAHDFNNMLTVIIGNIEMMQRALAAGDQDRVQRAMGNALKGAESAGALTQRLLAFARRQALAPRPVEAGALVRGMEPLLARAVGQRIALSLDLAPALPPMVVDPGELENAILNLAVNARDAMPEGGRLILSTALRPGDQIEIAVADTGTGMPPEVLERAFEPFFTTKAQDKGTGLGLSTVHGFARQSGGSIAIESAPGAGTTVRLRFPLARNIAILPLAAPAAEAGGTETVLLVEDEEAIAEFAAEVLAEAGYRVLRAADGSAARRILEGGAAIDLVLADIIMPGALDGLGLARIARAGRPGIPVLLVTGNTVAPPGSAGEFPVLHKPYRRGALLARVRAALDQATAPN